MVTNVGRLRQRPLDQFSGDSAARENVFVAKKAMQEPSGSWNQIPSIAAASGGTYLVPARIWFQPFCWLVIQEQKLLQKIPNRLSVLRTAIFADRFVATEAYAIVADLPGVNRLEAVWVCPFSAWQFNNLRAKHTEKT